MEFEFDHNYILENERVLLRPLEFLDIENLLAFSINEPELWNYSLLPASNEAELKKYIQIALEKRKNKIDYPFIVFDKKTNSYAGSTRFYDIQLANKTLQLGFT